MYTMWLHVLTSALGLGGASPMAWTPLGIAAIGVGTLGLVTYALVKAFARRRARRLARDRTAKLPEITSPPLVMPLAGERDAPPHAPVHQPNDVIAGQPTAPLRDRSEWRVTGSAQSRPLTPVDDIAAADTGPLRAVAVAAREAADMVEAPDDATSGATQVSSQRQPESLVRSVLAIPTPTGPAPAAVAYARGIELLSTSAGSEVALREALAQFRRAQETWTRELAPEQWAIVQNEIGRVYQELPGADRATNLRTAIMHYQSALEVFDPVRHAMNWAWTQSALGAVYQALPSGSPLANARAAVAYHQRALDVFTRDNAPLAWAWNQNNLGTALETMRGGEQGERVADLRQAAACYEAALQVYTAAEHRAHHDVVARNLARVQHELKILE